MVERIVPLERAHLRLTTRTSDSRRRSWSLARQRPLPFLVVVCDLSEVHMRRRGDAAHEFGRLLV